MAKESIDKLLNFKPQDIEKMSRAELSKVVSRLSATANKRVERLARSPLGEYSPAFGKIVNSGRGRFGAKGKDKIALQNEYKSLTNFMKDSTSTVSGWKKKQKEYRKKAKERGFEAGADFYAILTMLYDRYPYVFGEHTPSEVYNAINLAIKYNPNGSNESVLNEVLAMLGYEIEEHENEYPDTEDFFEL